MNTTEKEESERKIHVAGNGKEYYNVQNIYHDSGLFTNRMGDAIRMIKEDHADEISITKVLSFTLIDARRYIDRDYGEKIRQKSIEEAKNVKIAFAIKYNHLNSFETGRLLMKNRTLFAFGDSMDDVKLFDTEEEAKSEIDNIIKKSREYLDLYVSLIEGPDKCSEKEADDKVYEKLKEDFGFVHCINMHVFISMQEALKSDKPTFKLDVVQIALDNDKEKEIN